MNGLKYVMFYLGSAINYCCINTHCHETETVVCVLVIFESDSK